MSEKILCKHDSLNFKVNEEDEFLNIFNYKNVKCFKSSHYIYIGQIRKDNESFVGKENISDATYRKNEDLIKESTKEYIAHKEKVDKKKKKKHVKYIKEGYGIMISLRKNMDGEEIIVNKFIGNWKNDKKNGLGFNIYLNKNIFYGYYEDDLRNGWGYFKWESSGSTFEGYWLNNFINGKGIYRNRNFSYDGNFYDNKFINSIGEWVNIFELEEENKTQAINNIISNNIHLVLLPFDFIKIHLKEISKIIKHNFNKVPFIICSKKFIEKNKYFSLSKMVFLSYYFGSFELSQTMNHMLFFNSVKNNNSKNKNTEILGIKKLSCNYDSSISEKSVGSEINKEINRTNYSKDSNESNCSDHSKDSHESNNSNISKDLDEFNIFSESHNSSDSYTKVNYSNVSNYSSDSKDSFNFRLKKNKYSKNSNLFNSKIVEINKNRSNEGELKEYLKNYCKLDDFKNKSISGSISKNNDNLKRETINFKKSINCNSEKIDDISSDIEEKRKNEIHNLINNYLNTYLDTEDSSSDYSLMFSETEKSDNNENSEKIEKEENVIQSEKETDKNQEKHKEQDEKEQESEKKKKKMDKKLVEMIKENDNEFNSFNSNKEIEEELSKIKVDISFIKKIIDMNLSCESIIKKKIKNSLLLKYPFIFNLNISEDINKYEIIDNEFILEHCKIPEFWDLKSYFCDKETKLTKEIFSPLYFDLNNSYKYILNSPNIEENKINENLNENNFCENFNLNFFVITDLLVDETEDIDYLKNLIKSKFNNYTYINKLFFVVIE